MQNAQNKINVVSAPLPFSNLQTQAFQVPGSTLSEIVNNVVPERYKNAGLGAIVMINGEIIPVEHWDKVKPKENTLVNVRVVPQGGGGGKNPIATLLSIAVLVAAPYLAPIIGAAVGVTSTIGIQLIGAAVGALGRLAISALAPPPTPSNAGVDRVNNPTQSPTQFIEGARNSLNPYGVVPINLGTNRMFPLQAARPFTESESNDQYVRQLFTYGFAQKTVIENLRIGETALDEFDNFDIEHKLDGDLHEGTDLYVNDVFQEDLSVTLNQADGYTTRTTAANVDEAVVDITFPRGLASFNDQGGRNGRRVTLEMQYAKTGESPQNWSPGGAEYKDFSGGTYTITPVVSSGYNNRGGGGTRTDVVVINKYSGRIQIVQGQNGFQTSQPIPSGSIRLANIVVTTAKETNAFGQPTGALITSFTLADVRQSSLFGSTLEDSASFAPTKINTTQFTIDDGAILINDLDIFANQSEALRKSVRVVFPERAQYDVRIRRTTANSSSDQVLDESTWTALKSVRYESPVNLVGLSGTAMRIKATDQLNGALDQFNVIASTVIPDYDPNLDEWVDRITSNPAALYRYVYQGEANDKPLSDEQLNIEDLEAWSIHCVEQGYTYNRVIDYETSVDAIIRDICAAGAASPAIVDGKRTVVIDKIKDDITTVITPRNSWGYSGEMLYPETPHALRVQFRNEEKGFIQDELIVYDDGYDESNATLFEVLELQSCTNADLAFKTARRHLASIKLRPETHTFMQDVEHLVALRGDRVKFEHDAPIIGVGDARIKTVITSGDSPNTVTGITLDDTITIPNNGMYFVRIRLGDGTQLYKEIATSAGASVKAFDFVDPFDVVDTPAAGDLCYFVEAGGELDLVITRIEPQDDLTARITAIDYAPEIFDAENSPIPAFNSNITTPLEFIRPVPPLLLDEQSNESVMLVNSDGSFTPRAVFTLENLNDGLIDTKVKIRVSGTDSFTNANVLEATPERLVITGLEDAMRYDIHIRYRRAGTNTYSKPLELNNYLFVGASGKPDQVTGFTINVVDNISFFKWDKNDDIDFSHYHIKYSNVFTGASWATAQTLDNEIYETKYTTPFLGGTYLIKAVDLTGNESDTATAIITYDPGVVANAVAVLEEQPDFVGLTDNVIRDVGTIILGDPDIDTGYYYFDGMLNLTAAFPSFVSAKVIANGAFLNNVFAESDIFAMDDVFGQGDNDVFAMDDVFANDDIFGIGLDGWAVGLEYRTTQTDPSYTDPTNNLIGALDNWTDARGTLTLDNAQSPERSLNAATFLESTDNGQHYLRSDNPVIALDQEHSYSIFVKAKGRNVRMRARNKNNTSNYFYADFDLENAAIFDELDAGTATLNEARIEYYGNDWYRISLSGIVDNAGSDELEIWVYTLEIPETLSYEGITTLGLEVFGPEVIAAAQPYVPTFSDWVPLEAGTITFWGIQFRLKMQSLQENVTPQVTTLSVNIDMPDRIERGEDLDLPVEGAVITFDPMFKATPAIAITIQDGAVDDKVEYITKNSGGFSFKVYNETAGGYVSRTFDYIASGFGRKNG